MLVHPDLNMQVTEGSICKIDTLPRYLPFPIAIKYANSYSYYPMQWWHGDQSNFVQINGNTRRDFGHSFRATYTIQAPNQNKNPLILMCSEFGFVFAY